MVAYSFKSRFRVPIKLGLGLEYPIDWIEDIERDSRPKMHTIRAHGRRRHARPDELVQLYYGMRTRQCELLGVGLCSSVKNIVIRVGGADLDIGIEGKPLKAAALDTFAQADGFKDLADMHGFWRKNHPGVEHFDGGLIQWRRQS